MNSEDLNFWYEKISKEQKLYVFDSKKKKTIKLIINTLDNAPLEILNNEEFILKAFNNNHLEINKISQNLLNKKDFILKLIENKYISLYAIPTIWQKDEEILLKILKKNSSVFYSLIELDNYKNLKFKESLANKLLEINPDIILNHFFPFKNDFNFIKKSILLNPKLIKNYKKNYTKNLFSNEEEVKKFLDVFPKGLEFLDTKFRNNADLVLPYIQNDVSLLEFAGNKLKNNENFMSKFFSSSYFLFKNLGKKLSLNPIFLEKLLNHNPSLIKFIDKSIINEEFLIKLLKKSPNIYPHLSEEYKNKDLIIAYYLNHEYIVSIEKNNNPIVTVENLPNNIINKGLTELKNFDVKNNINLYDYIKNKYLKILLEYELIKKNNVKCNMRKLKI